MTAGMGRIEAGRAFLRLSLEDKDFRRSLRTTQRDMARWASAMSRAGAGLAAFGGASLMAFGRFTRGVADIETGARRFELIFKDMAGAVRAELEALSGATGLPMTTLIQQASQFGAIFASMRESVTDEQFAQIIGRTMKAVTDLAAVGGISIEEAAERMKSGFTSTGESVDQFGFNLRKANLQAEATRLGMKQSIMTMSEQQKQLLKLSIFMRQANTTGVSFVKMVDTINGQFTLMRANLVELVAQGGWFVKLVMVPLLRGVNMLLIAMRPLAKALSPLFVLFGAAGGAALGAGGLLIGGAGILAASAWALQTWLSMGPQIVIVLANISRGLALTTASFLSWAAAINLTTLSLIRMLGVLGALAYIVHRISRPPQLQEEIQSKYPDYRAFRTNRNIFGMRDVVFRRKQDVGAGVADSISAFSSTAGAFGGNIGQRLGFGPGSTAQNATELLGDLKGLWDSVISDQAVRVRTEAG